MYTVKTYDEAEICMLFGKEASNPVQSHYFLFRIIMHSCIMLRNYTVGLAKKTDSTARLSCTKVFVQFER